MKERSNWAKQQLKRMFELEGGALDIIAVHDAAIELSLESPLIALQEARSVIIEKKLKLINKENSRLPNLPENSLSNKGYVYVVKSPRGKYKIGQTKNVSHRVLTLQTSFDEKLQLVLKVKTSNRKVLESICHRKFDDKKVRGEWFDLSDDDLKWIKNLPKT